MMEGITNFLQAIVNGEIDVDAQTKYEAAEVQKYLSQAEELSMLGNDIGCFAKPYYTDGVLQEGVAIYENYLLVSEKWYKKSHLNMLDELNELKRKQSAFTESILSGSTSKQLRDAKVEIQKLKDKLAVAEKRYKKAENLLNKEISDSFVTLANADEKVYVDVDQSIGVETSGENNKYISKYKLVKDDLEKEKIKNQKLISEVENLSGSINNLRAQLDSAMSQYRDAVSYSDELKDNVLKMEATISNQEEQIKALSGKVGYADMKAVYAKATKETNRMSANKARRENKDSIRAGVFALDIQGKTYRKFGAEGYELFLGTTISEGSYYRYREIKSYTDVRFIYQSYRQYQYTYFNGVSLDQVDKYVLKRVKKVDVGINSPSDLLKYKNEAGLLVSKAVSEFVYVFIQALNGVNANRIKYNFNAVFGRDVTPALLKRGIAPSTEQDLVEIYTEWLTNPYAFNGRTINDIVSYIESVGVNKYEQEKVFKTVQRKLGK